MYRIGLALLQILCLAFGVTSADVQRQQPTRRHMTPESFGR